MNLEIRINTLPLIPQMQLWRVPHDVERYNVDQNDWRYAGARIGRVREAIRRAGVARPEIYRVYPDHTTRIGEKHQWLWKDINWELSKLKWRSLLGNTLAWTNGTGFPGHRDYVNQMELDMTYPTFHAALVNGGMILEGVEEGDRVWIKSLLTSESVPTAQELLKGHSWSYGVGVIPSSGNINFIQRLGIDGTYKRVRVPFITTQRVWLPKNELHKLSLESLPPPQNWIVGD